MYAYIGVCDIGCRFALRKKCPCLEMFWSGFSCIPTEYGKIGSISPYLVRTRDNVDQNNSECGRFPAVFIFKGFTWPSSKEAVDFF